MAGFRYIHLSTDGGSPFDCERCSPTDRKKRNCANMLALSEGARAVTEYTGDVERELKEKGAGKVVVLGNMRLYECPLSYITEDTWEIVRMIRFLEHTGRLPLGGGWADQPYWFVEAYGLYLEESGRWQKLES